MKYFQQKPQHVPFYENMIVGLCQIFDGLVCLITFGNIISGFTLHATMCFALKSINKLSNRKA